MRLMFFRTIAKQVSVLVFLSYYRRLAYAVEALVSDHLVNSKYLALSQWSLTRVSSRKRPHNRAWSLMRASETVKNL